MGACSAIFFFTGEVSGLAGGGGLGLLLGDEGGGLRGFDGGDEAFFISDTGGGGLWN